MGRRRQVICLNLFLRKQGIKRDSWDFVIVTSDNPRTEDPGQILLDIEQGVLECNAFTGQYELIADRKQAIERAISIVRPGDIILIAGKGHETYQILKDQTIHFDDREEAEEAIRRTKLNR